MNARFDDFRAVRLWRGFNRLTQLALATALVSGLLYLASQPAFYLRRDISATHAHSLAPETLARLRAIGDKAASDKKPMPPVEVFLLFPETVKGEGEKAENMRELLGKVNPRIDAMLETFAYEISRDKRIRMSVTRIDQTIHAKTYGELNGALLAQRAPMNEFTAIVVRCGDRVRAIGAGDLLAVSGADVKDYDRFRGESAFLSALLDVTDFRPTVVYYTTNHGELSPAAKTPALSDAGFFDDLRDRRFELRPLDLSRVKDDEIPTDADMILIAGPRLPFSSRECLTLRRYMKPARNGRVMVLLDPRPVALGAHAASGLEDLFKDWGVRSPGAWVVEQNRNCLTSGGDILIRSVAPLRHPAIESFRNLDAPLTAGAFLPFQKDASALQEDDTLDVQPLLETSKDASWGEWDVGPGMKFEAAKGDIPPPLDVLMVAERAVRVNGETRVAGGRLFLLGTADIAADQRYELNGNRQLLLGGANWLTGREYLVNVTARPLSVFRLNATLDDLVDLAKRYALPPLVFALLGLAVGWWRRRT